MSNNVVQFRGQMDKMADEFSKVLPAHLTPDRLYRTTINAVQSSPKLLQADRTSLLSAVMTSAVLGLEPDGVTGQGYLVPFKGKVQFIPGYKGLITLAYNSGFTLEGHTIHEHDQFSYKMGTSPHIDHYPADFGSDRGGVVGAYATARNNDCPTVAVVLDLKELMAIRDKSAGFKAMGRSSPWSTDFPAMCRKSAIRRLGGNLPLNVQRAVALENAHDQGTHAHINPEGAVVQEDGSEILPKENVQ